MDCEKCGAGLDDDAAVCPECGEPVEAAAPEDEAFAEAAPEAPAEASETPEPATAADRPKSGGKRWLTVAMAVVVIALLAGAGLWAYSTMSKSESPEGVARAMLTAYAAYDAQGILDTATHKTLPADGVKEFEKQAAEAKKRAGDKPGVKNFDVTKVTSDSATQATVEITGEWLTDPAKGTYTKRTEKLTVVKEDGKWLVKLF
jgi:hypothetical protein